MDTSSSPAAPLAGTDRRLAAKLGSDTPMVAWGQAWVSRSGRFNKVIAARTLDFVVCTEHDLVLFSTGFFTRRPRRRVYWSPFDRLRVSVRKAKRGRELVVSSLDHRALVFQMRKSPRSDALIEALVRHAAESDIPAS
jgi:hypothetical protein